MRKGYVYGYGMGYGYANGHAPYMYIRRVNGDACCIRVWGDADPELHDTTRVNTGAVYIYNIARTLAI